MQKIEKIKIKLKKLEPLLKEKFKVKRIGIFGSYARGEAGDKSDLDILVEFCEPVGLFNFLELENFLAQKAGLKVDLIMKDTLKLRIKDRILNEVVYV